MFPATNPYVVSALGERNRYSRMSEELRTYVRTEHGGDAGTVLGWIEGARGPTAMTRLRTAARSAAQAAARAARSVAGALARPGGA